ncbi:toprim domain-containing protein [Rhodospirillum sp. A1_3_36]|uniref:toprim domain-containing protein n=1 Tax=Rhodospirillum sp. A1_3_36 TaxID=3391666 RepID=UPI0039A623AC
MTKRFFHPDELSAIRDHCDWRRLLDELGVRADVRRCTDAEFWGYSPFHPEEKTASFHMKEPGVWYDWSSHASAPGRDKPGGGVIELVQAIHATRGQMMKLNEVAAWIVDRGFGPSVRTPAAKPSTPNDPADPSPSEACNAPINIDLVPRLSELGTHPAFVERGISAETCRTLSCGYLKGTRSMLAQRLVFQVGGLDKEWSERVILSHMGRATTEEQERDGKWRFYRGFNPSLKLYNLDNLVLDPGAARQARETGTLLVVEGTFDVAKCVEAGLRNVVATFGARLHEPQARKLAEALSRLSASRAIVFYDRDKAGRATNADALEMLSAYGVEAEVFDWEREFTGGDARSVSISKSIMDPCDLAPRQLAWLRARGLL